MVNKGELQALAPRYFKVLFTASPTSNCEKLLTTIQPCISKLLNKELMADFTEEEVIEALKSVAPLKAAGNDGFPAIFFFQKFRHIVCRDVTAYCLEMLNENKDIRCINDTNLVLIPRVLAPGNMGQFRLITLCRVIYKIISKSIVNRFRKSLQFCIDKKQEAFIPGR